MQYAFLHDLTERSGTMDAGSGNRLARGMGAGIAIGAGIGIAMGVALDNIALGIAIGGGIGVALGTAIGARGEPSGDTTPKAQIIFIVAGLALGLILLAGLALIVWLGR
jgi:hypothetical protein